jgi:hypothetical protein
MVLPTTSLLLGGQLFCKTLVSTPLVGDTKTFLRFDGAAAADNALTLITSHLSSASFGSALTAFTSSIELSNYFLADSIFFFTLSSNCSANSSNKFIIFVTAYACVLAAARRCLICIDFVYSFQRHDLSVC